ncbi:MAG: hypothetical protein HC938_00600 [Nitrospira sp.]|nr:hypothetical protein [Nitrospira sp.]
MTGVPASMENPIRNDGTTQLAEIIQQRLSSTVAALTSATQALTALNTKQAPMKFDDLPSEIAHEIQRSLRPIMSPLQEAVQDLTRAINSQSSSVQLTQSEIETMFQELRSHTPEKQ